MLWRVTKVLLIGLAVLVLAGAAALGWVWFQGHQISELERAGKFADATRLTERALAIFEKLGAGKLPRWFDTLARLYQAQGRYLEAEPLYKRALAIDEQELGPEHPDVAQSLDNLAELYRAQGRYPEAEPLYKRALAIREKGFGAEHRELATALFNLALLYNDQGRYPEALALMKRALAIDEKALGPEHPELATALTASPSSIATRAATPRPSRSSGAAWPSARIRWNLTTPMSQRRSSPWPRCTGTRTATPRPSRSTSAASDQAAERGGHIKQLSHRALRNSRGSDGRDFGVGRTGATADETADGNRGRRRIPVGI